jgi:hypothetical protein
MYAQIINTILGILIMILPDVFDFEKTAANVFHIVGPLVVMFAFTAIFESTRLVRWVNAPLGILLIFAPFISDDSEGYPVLFSIIMGGVVFGFSLIKGKAKHHFSGGWKELFQ